MSKKNLPIWTMDNQFKKHDIKNQKRLGDIAINDFGKPEGFFVYGNRGSQREFTVDIDVHYVNLGTAEKPDMKEEVVGAQLLCPRCGSPLYVKGEKFPEGHPIVVHWDVPIRSDVDGLLRPPVSIDGVLGCDYYDFEINESARSRNTNVSLRCGWKGGIIGGQCFDHQSVAMADYNAAQAKKLKEQEAQKKLEDQVKRAKADAASNAQDGSTAPLPLISLEELDRLSPDSSTEAPSVDIAQGDDSVSTSGSKTL